MTSPHLRSASKDKLKRKSNNERALNYRREVSVQLTPVREMRPQDRRHNATHVPESVLRPGLLSMEQQNRLNIFQMKNEERIFWKNKSKTHFSSVWLDENSTRPCHKEMERLQELILKSQLSKKLAKNEKTGDIIYLSISTGRAGLRIQPNASFYNKENSRNDPSIREMIRLMGSVVEKLFRIGLPSDLVEVFQKRSALDISLGAGHHDNVFTSQMQVNVSLLKEDLPTAIGAGGALHMDANNDVSRLSIVIFLSHLPQDYCPGKFILPSESVYCVTAPYTAIICSGHLPHWPIPPRNYEPNSIRYVPAGPIPPRPKNLEFRRISMVSYPEKVAMNRATKFISEIMLKPESLFLYGTKRNQHEFWARLQAQKTVDIATESNIQLDETDTSQIILDNSWVENGETQFPRSQLISEILFGEPNDAEWQDRKIFILENSSCGYHFEGGGRKSKPILTIDEDSYIFEMGQMSETPAREPASIYLNKDADNNHSTTKSTNSERSKARTKMIHAKNLEIYDATITNTDEQRPLLMGQPHTENIVILPKDPETLSDYSALSETDIYISRLDFAQKPVMSSDDMSSMTKTGHFSEVGSKRKRNLSESDLKQTSRESRAGSFAVDASTPHASDQMAVKSIRRSQIAPKKIADYKYRQHLQKLVAGTLDESLSVDDYDAQIKELGRLKAESPSMTGRFFI